MVRREWKRKEGGGRLVMGQGEGKGGTQVRIDYSDRGSLGWVSFLFCSFFFHWFVVVLGGSSLGR